MSFVRHTGKTKIMYFRKTDTDLVNSLRDGSLVAITDSGSLRYCRNDTVDRVVGVCRQRVLAVDTSDTIIGWEKAPLVPVEVPVENAVEWLIDVDTTGGAVDSDIGRYVAVDTAEAGDSESTRVDMSDTVIRQVYVTAIVSGTQIIGTIAKSAFGWPGPGGADTVGGALADEDTT